VGTIEKQKLTEALQDLLSFLLLTGINAVTAVVGWGQGKNSTDSF